MSVRYAGDSPAQSLWEGGVLLGWILSSWKEVAEWQLVWEGGLTHCVQIMPADLRKGSGRKSFHDELF